MIKAWAWADLTQAGLSFLLRNGNKTLQTWLSVSGLHSKPEYNSKVSAY